MTNKQNKKKDKANLLNISFLILFTIFLFSSITAANKQRQTNNAVKMQQEKIREYRAQNGITKRGVDEFSNEMRILHEGKKL